MSSRRPWSPPDVVEPYGPVTGPVRLVVRTRFGGDPWESWSWARPTRVHEDADAARRLVDGPARRLSLWFLARGGLSRRADSALHVQYGLVPADAPKP